MRLEDRVRELEEEVKQLRGEGEAPGEYIKRMEATGGELHSPLDEVAGLDKTQLREEQAAAKAIREAGGKPEDYERTQLFAAAKALGRSPDHVRVRLDGFVRHQPEE